MVDLYTLIIYPIIYILPAYIANGTPVIFGGGTPVDFGRKLLGKRIFGDNKTIKGLFTGIVGGALIGLFESPFYSYMFATGILLAAGAMFGDLLGSFIKRRVNYKSGASFPVMDQYGFFVFAMIFAYPLGNLPSSYGIIFLVILTGIVHPLMNIISHRLKLKDVPW